MLTFYFIKRTMFTIKWKVRFLLILLGSIVILLYFLPNSAPSKRNNELVNLRKLLLASIEVASMGGMQITKVFESDNMNQQSKGKTLEGKNDLVTDADYKSHCLMYHSLAQAFPSVNIISEEKPPENVCKELRSDSDSKLNLHPSVDHGTQILHDEFVPSENIVVWIDPLDATQEFTEGLTEYVTTMVCIAVNGKPVIGVIHSPFNKNEKTVWAWVGRGMSTNLHSRKRRRSNTSVVMISRSHTGNTKEIIEKAFGKDILIITAGGAGYKILQVMNGNATAYIHTTAIKKWDICAGNALIKSAGGRMTTINGRDIDYFDTSDVVNVDGILASTINYNWYYSKLKLAKSFYNF